ncbi:MAG: LLM class flavin-dependent oxidoreductase [Deltaproteobacteria bacterium]|nr:LLM class flavin-dependent oxidoreductase [Deltaproteobacteria bacterium]
MSIKISAELSHICPLEDVKEHAESLEQLGYYRIWVPDTVASPWEAWLAASLIVHHTNRVHIGVGVMNPHTRHPFVTAQMAATLQHLSGGRLALSIGKGIGRFLEKAGINQHESAVEEFITVLRQLIAGERTSLDGNAFHLDGLRIRVRPPSEPVPIYMAAIGMDSWRSALQVADGVETMWHDQCAETRRLAIPENSFPSAVLLPFSISRKNFFPRQVGSVAELQDRVSLLDESGFDEAVVAYGDMADLETAAKIIRNH